MQELSLWNRSIWLYIWDHNSLNLFKSLVPPSQSPTICQCRRSHRVMMSDLVNRTTTSMWQLPPTTGQIRMVSTALVRAQREQFWAYHIIISRLSADKRLWPCILVNQFIIYKYCTLHFFFLACCYFMSSETLLCEMCYDVLCSYFHGWIWMFKLKLYIDLFYGTM